MRETQCQLVGLMMIFGVLGCDGEEDGDTNGDGGGDLDTDTDSDTDSDSDSDADTGVAEGIDYQPMSDCSGGVYDPNSDLCWENPYNRSSFKWEEAKVWCESLDAGGHTDWRLPTISELRSFYRPGDNPKCLGIGWSMDWEDVPAGYCPVHDGCVSSDCFSMELCAKLTGSGCYQADGPGEYENCYWDSYITGSAICSAYWSSSLTDEGDEGWSLNFRRPTISVGSLNVGINVRCVRTGN